MIPELLAAEHVRLGGVLVAALFAAYGIVSFRRGGWSRFELLLALLIAAGVVVVSVFPQVGEVFTRLFGLKNRAFALLSFASLLLFGLFLYLLGQVGTARRRGREIVGALALREYMARFGSPEMLTPHGQAARGAQPGRVLVLVPAYNEGGR